MRRLASTAFNSVMALVFMTSTSRADDTEIFFTETKSGGDANLMLVLDTSGSMGNAATSTPKPYDSTLSYTLSRASCQSGRLYYRPTDPLNTTPPTTCTGLSFITYDIASPSTTHNKCKASQSALQYGPGYSERAGFYRDRFIRWGGSSSSRNWNATLDVSTNASSVECLADAGTDGNLSNSNPYPRSGPTSDTVGRWGSAGQTWWSNANIGKEYILWSPNYIAYSRSPPATTQTRMEVVKEAATSLLSQVSNMNVGIMRYDTDGNGGMVLAPAKPIDAGTNRADLIALINGFNEAGNTPLSETLFEAYRYFSGGAVEYGGNSKVCSVAANNANCPTGSKVAAPSVPSSRFPATSASSDYDSPADASCQNNYIVFLTDGLPNSDNQADTLITGLGATCDASGPSGASPSSAGKCLSAMSRYMYEQDLRGNVEGKQNVKTYFIGFGDEFQGNLNNSLTYLNNAAEVGGGRAYQAGSLSELEGAFNSIVNEVVDTNTTFTSPTVAVNAFNRTQTLSDLYVSVFQPSLNRHWPGNLKKYKVDNGVIQDDNGQAAVDPSTGFFKPGARSLWSGVTDGYDVSKGGAASLIPDPGSRKIYTYVGVGTPSSMVDLTGNSHAFRSANSAITDTWLGIGGSGDPTRDDLFDWALGEDVRDVDPVNGNNTETRHVMGDPIHAQPAVVIYGGTTSTPSLDDAVIYIPTNDGYLHAVDTQEGKELWSFIPYEVLPQLKGLYQNQKTTTKQYALDGEIQVLKYDINADGIIDSDAGDRVILYFGQGRGGSTYYALDVTSKTTPKFMWSINSSVLPNIGQAWSTPVVARVNVAGVSQNSQKLALIIGGGYDSGEDGAAYVTSAASGNRIYIVDALKGTLLWSAGSSASNANLKLARMEHSIPSRVTVLDTNQDGYADRMYVGDMAAQIWRFDITNGNAPNSLVAGGVIASLGSHDENPHTEEHARRFYNAPDVAAMQLQGQLPFLNIAIGSGYRGHPLNEVNQDRFYALRDHKPFTPMTQAQYNTLLDNEGTFIKDGDLLDVTKNVNPTIPADSPGWKILLNQPGDSWVGEKVLSAANTFDNKIFFTTYRPSRSATNACTSNSAGTGANRAFVVNALDGSPIQHQNDSGTGGDTGTGGDDDKLTPEDRYTDLNQGGIAPEISFLFPEPNKIVCLSGVEVLGACTNFNSRVKTYWRDSNAN
ncbi:pilus assembly protein [Povalibacter sp.]|uniref:pilus assembly protein n=1 Tax=Povalibacter sp. TaxID=1962978 RepID=UPI002F40ED48